jgi:hypothetical protein
MEEQMVGQEQAPQYKIIGKQVGFVDADDGVF